MNPPQAPLVDRRRFPRSEILATAVVFSPDRLHGTYLVSHLSASGASLLGGPSLNVGASVRIMMQLPGKAPGSLPAKVIRRGEPEAAGTRFGVAFTDLRPEDEDEIQQALLGELERMRARLGATVMMMYHEGSTRDGLERDLRRLGHESVCVSTPLEALGWLERPDVAIRTVLVDLGFGPARGVDMLHYLSEHHPDIQRFILCDDQRSYRLDLALRSGRAQGALMKPWNDAGIEGLLTGALGAANAGGQFKNGAAVAEHAHRA